MLSNWLGVVYLAVDLTLALLLVLFKHSITNLIDKNFTF